MLIAVLERGNYISEQIYSRILTETNNTAGVSQQL
jgi:hypothetical protein